MNIIKFIPVIKDNLWENILIPPVKSSKKIPDWYKELAPYKVGTSNNLKDLNPTNDRGSDGSDVSTKLCMPFLDAISSGYMYCLEDDLLVELDENGLPNLSWKKDIFLIDKRPRVDMPIPKECHPVHFGIKMNWYYETPPGYSLLFTHPLNRFDLPFYTPSGIVDSDIWGLPVFISFFLKKDFQGIIPQGTPIFQIIPIKREEWDLNIDSTNETIEKHKVLEENRRSHITAHYKKSVWQKKNY